MEKREILRARFEAPDGGYGWFVAFGAFLVQFWIAGLIKSYGVIFMEVIQLYPDASASLASWIPAILSTLCLVFSPISSALCQRFSCREVVFTGGLLCWLGVSLSFFATNLLQLCVTLGVITGFGAGFSTTPGIIMTSRYFNKRRALANGLCVSGTAAGSILIPPLMDLLVPTYGFRGSILILGACMLHICLSAALYRPIEVHQAIVERVSKAKIEDENVAMIKDDKTNNDHHTTISGLTTIEENETLGESLKETFSHRPSIVHSIEDLSTDSTVYYKENVVTLKPNSACEKVEITTVKESTHKSKSSFGNNQHSKLCSITKYIDLSLLKNPLFLLMASTVMFMAVGCPHALFYLPSYANSRGLERSECSLLLSISAVFDLAGRLGLGYIADLNLFSRHKAYSASMLMSATALLCAPFAKTFPVFAVIVAFYGFGLGSWLLLIPVLLSDNHGTDAIASSYGLIRLFQGIVALMVPPLVGLSKDLSGDYIIGFYCMGVSMTLGSVLIHFKPCVLHTYDQNRDVNNKN